MGFRKALVTFGTGPLEPMRASTLPAMTAYAARHGYNLVANCRPTLDPPSWGKIPLLLEILDTHDAALWLDADVLIVDGSEDIADHVYGHQGLVAHVTRGDGRVPNTGIWYLTRRCIPLLLEALELFPRYAAHPWWEQAAIIERLPGHWESVTTWLDPGWNRHRHDLQPTDRVRLMHFTAVPDRVRRCQEAAELVYGAADMEKN